MELLENSSNWIIALGKTVLNSLWLGFLFLSLLKALFLLIPKRFGQGPKCEFRRLRLRLADKTVPESVGTAANQTDPDSVGSDND